MRIRLLKSIGASTVFAAAFVIANYASAAAVEAPASALKTSWGEPDLQGIWTVESDTPLQRSPKFANQEFFTAAQREELDKVDAGGPRRGSRFCRRARS
jgi:hypothetical protein